MCYLLFRYFCNGCTMTLLVPVYIYAYLSRVVEDSCLPQHESVGKMGLVFWAFFCQFTILL